MKILSPKTWPAPALHGFKGLSVFIALVIIYASLTPSGPSIAVAHMDKLMHALAYGALTGAICLGWPQMRDVNIIFGAAALGVALECAQAIFALGRTASIFDAGANVAGVCLALAVLYPFRRKT